MYVVSVNFGVSLSMNHHAARSASPFEAAALEISSKELGPDHVKFKKARRYRRRDNLLRQEFSTPLHTVGTTT